LTNTNIVFEIQSLLAKQLWLTKKCDYKDYIIRSLKECWVFKYKSKSILGRNE